MAEENKMKSFDPVFIVIGVTLILIGILLFLGNIFNFLSPSKLWPLFILIPIPIFAWQLMQDFKRSYGVLVPFGILTFLAVYFLWLNFAGWEFVAVTWPNFILTPAVGLFLLFLANREKKILIPIFILTATTLICYGALLKSNIAIAICFLLGGIAIIYGSIRKKTK